MKTFYYEKKQRAINEDAFLLITAFSNVHILLSEMIFFSHFSFGKILSYGTILLRW